MSPGSVNSELQKSSEVTYTKPNTPLKSDFNIATNPATPGYETSFTYKIFRHKYTSSNTAKLYLHDFQKCDAGTISAIGDKLGATLTYQDGDELPLGGIFLAEITKMTNNGFGMLCSNFIFLPSDSEITVHYSGGASNAAETALLTSKYKRIAT